MKTSPIYLFSSSPATAAKVFDATGTFEAREVIGPEQTGKLIDYAVDEGQMLKPMHVWQRSTRPNWC